mgnify:CR=1 FL=1
MNRLSRQAMREIFGAAIGDSVESGIHRGKLAMIMIDECTHVSYAIDGIYKIRTGITLVNEESAQDVRLCLADEPLQYGEDVPIIGGKP